MEDTQNKSSAPDFNKLELEVLEQWEKSQIFEKSLEQTNAREPYVFYDGPPFATGLPHYGHILASTIKDAIPRYQTMKGKYVRRRWGWDCHGLPIENIVEQKLGISGKKQIEELGIEKFNQACRENVLTFVAEWGKTVRRMGRWVDFENSYKTMDTTFMESVWWGLKQLWGKDLIYQDRKVLLYCPRCETPISNFEVAMDNSYRDITEEAVYVKFKLVPRQRIADFIVDDKTFIVAWTTTPWTLPGNTALNIGPEIRYVLVEVGGAHLVVAKDRLSVLGEGVEVKQEFSARSLEGVAYEPLYSLEEKHENGEASGDMSKAYRLYTEDYVTTEDGTGVVHNAAMYGEEDYQAAKKRDLPRRDMLNQKGEYLDNAPEFLTGVYFKDANALVLADLEKRGLVYKLEHYTHSYPHCWRCGTPLYYSALPSWFVNIQSVKQGLLKSNEAEVAWYPAHLKHGRFQKSVENAPDWNISRNRFWATPLPFWVCSNEACKHKKCVGSIAELREQSVNFDQVYPSYDPGNPESLDLHRPYIDNVIIECEQCGSDMRRISEVVDCWVESGSMPFAELHAPFENEELFRARYPADFVAEYIAQTRTWFYVMHVLGVTLFGKAPFKHVVTTGTILAEDGSKMSKSKNNYPDPWLVIDRYGIDAVRFYLLATPVMLAEDLNFSEKGVKEVYQKVNMLLYNVWSFYRMYAKEKMRAESIQLTEKHALDVWVLERLKQLQAVVTSSLDAYNTPKACREIVEFINDLSTWYVRRSRDRIKAGSDESKQALTVLGYVLVKTAQVLAPISPFLSDYIFRDITGEVSVHLTEWPNESAQIDQRVLEQMDIVREVVSMALAARKGSGVSVRQPLAALAYSLKTTVPLSADHEQLILEELNVKTVVEYSALSDKANIRASVVRMEGLGNVAEVLLDTELTEELQQEGLARELERAVQDLRKKSGLSVGEVVDVYYNTQDEALEKVLLSNVDRKKTFVNQITKSLEVEVDFEVQAVVARKAVWLGLVKV